MAQTVPYLTEQQIRDKYAKALTDYTNQRNAEADREKASVNSNYDNTQRQNYVQFMENRRDLPEQMARMGVSGGGASETSALRAQTNYENLRNNTERSRNSDINKINTTLADTLNTYRMTADQNMNDEIAQNAQLRANYEKQLQQEAEQRFANTISGYDSIPGIDSEIAKISRSGVDTWRIPYLRARRAELAAALAAQQAAVASSGGGGGSSRSYGGSSSSSSSGGGGGGSTGITKEEAIAAVRQRFGIDGSRSTRSALASRARSASSSGRSSGRRGLGSRLRGYR